MSKRIEDAARQLLLQRRGALLRSSEETLAEEERLLEVKEADWEDRAAALTAARLLDCLSDLELMQLNRVQAAIERIEHGTYGRCVMCQRPIARRRLEVLPEAERCMACTSGN
jgi:DnaK suppressor protein